MPANSRGIVRPRTFHAAPPAALSCHAESAEAAGELHLARAARGGDRRVVAWRRGLRVGDREHLYLVVCAACRRTPGSQGRRRRARRP